MRLSNSRLLSNNGRTASVSVTFQKNNQKFGWIQWSGPVEVVLEDGGWHIDSTRGLHPSRGHR